MNSGTTELHGIFYLVVLYFRENPCIPWLMNFFKFACDSVPPWLNHFRLKDSHPCESASICGRYSLLAAWIRISAMIELAVTRLGRCQFPCEVQGDGLTSRNLLTIVQIGFDYA